MWVFLNNAFLSIVEHYDNPNILLVRARFQEDINRAFPEAEVVSNAGTDYKYRASIPRDEVAEALRVQVLGINYTNFKASVLEKERGNTYMKVWSEMWLAQHERER